MTNLTDIVYKDTVPFIPPITYGKVIKVYDGDTITVAAALPYDGSPMYRFSVRINGIDCPEIRTKNKDEKTCALIAKKFIIEKAMNKTVTLQNVTTEKYGRLLADVICDDKSLGDLLILERLAVKYDGGKKHTPDNWLTYYTNKNKQNENENINVVSQKEPFYRRIINRIKK